MNVVELPAAQVIGPTDDEFQAAMTRARKRGALFAILLFEDADGEMFCESVNVGSAVHQRGMYFEAQPLFAVEKTVDGEN